MTSMPAALMASPQTEAENDARTTEKGEDGEVPSTADLRRAAASLRSISTLTAGCSEDSPADAVLRDRIELGADVLDAASGKAAV